MNQPADADERDLERFGYKQELRRGVGFISMYSLTFSYMSPTVGIFGVFVIGFAALGGGMLWAWPAVFVGQLLVALGFAELASHYPLAGSFFQWVKFLSPSKSWTWFTCWIYWWSMALTTAGVIATMPVTLVPLLNNLGWHFTGTLRQQQAIAFLTLLICLLLNIFGVKIFTAINNSVVLIEMVTLVVISIVFLVFHRHHSASVYTDTGGLGFSGSGYLVALFVGLWVMYGMDTASTLAEESRNPRVMAPRAVITSLCGSFALGFLFLAAVLIAVPGSIAKAIGSTSGLTGIIQANLSSHMFTLYLIIVNASVLVVDLAIMAALIRLTYGMARDRQLPGSAWYHGVSPRFKTPIGASVVAAILTGIFLIQYKSVAIIVVAATAVTYFAYIMANAVFLRARLRGWPTRPAPFRLGRIGIPVMVLGIVWEVAMVINLNWPRVITNPKPNETGGALDLGISFLNRVPIDWVVLGAVVLLGALYYGIAGSRLPDMRREPDTDVVGPGAAASADPGPGAI